MLPFHGDDDEDEDDEDEKAGVLELCPYCLKPGGQPEAGDFPECPHCGMDTSLRRRISMDAEVYEERARTPCLYCGETLLQGAEVCASCKALVPEPERTP